MVEPTSKRGQVRACFNTKGEKAAAALGAKLGVGNGRIVRWLKLWKGETTVEVKVMVPTPPKRRLRELENQVCLVSQPDLVGELVANGPKQSTVRWPNGNVNTVDNDWVRPV